MFSLFFSVVPDGLNSIYDDVLNFVNERHDNGFIWQTKVGCQAGKFASTFHRPYTARVLQ
jgi:hypothetical protein